MATIHLDKTNFSKEVDKSDIPVIIDFWAAWCGPCRMMAPVFEELSLNYTGKLKFTKLDVESNQDYAEKYGVQGIPCLIITKAGKEVDRVVGFGPKEVIKQKIDEILRQNKL